MYYNYLFVFIIINLTINSNSFIYNKINKYNYYTLNSKNKYMKAIYNNDNNYDNFVNNIELINFNDIENDKSFYFIIGSKSIITDILINDMKLNQMTGIFIPKNLYNKLELDIIMKENDISVEYKNSDLLIFDDFGFIGGIYELYSIMNSI